MAAELEVRGLRSRPTAKRSAKPVGIAALHRILINPYYIGTVRWGQVHHEDGRHTPLTDRETWDQVQAVLSSHRTGEKQREHPHYLKSSLVCGDCGEWLIVTHAKNRYGTTYEYFVCLGRHQRRGRCERQATLIASIETLVEEMYQRIQITDQHREHGAPTFHPRPPAAPR